MKTLLWIIVSCAMLAGGFFAGQYYEANRSLELEDIAKFKQRLADQTDDWKDKAGDWKDSVKDKLRDMLD